MFVKLISKIIRFLVCSGNGIVRLSLLQQIPSTLWSYVFFLFVNMGLPAEDNNITDSLDYSSESSIWSEHKRQATETIVYVCTVKTRRFYTSHWTHSYDHISHE